MHKLDLELDDGRKANWVSPTGFAIITRLFLGVTGVLMVLYCAIYKTARSELALESLKTGVQSVVTS